MGGAAPPGFINAGQIQIQAGNAPLNAPLGQTCFATYYDQSGVLWIGVPGVVINDPSIFSAPECMPVSELQTESIILLLITEAGAQVANWILTSQQDLANQLIWQNDVLIASLSGGGGGAGGFTDADRAMLSNVESKVASIQTTLQNFRNAATSKLNLLDTKVNNLSTDMTLDHASIQAAIVSGGGLTDDGLLAGIGDLLSGAWTWMTDLVTAFTTAVGDIEAWAEAAMSGIESAFMDTMNFLVDGMTLGLAFMSGEIAFAFDAIAQLILTPLSALGDIFDLFTIDFLDWLGETFFIDIATVETGAVTLLETFRRVVGEMKSEIGGTV